MRLIVSQEISVGVKWSLDRGSLRIIGFLWACISFKSRWILVRLGLVINSLWLHNILLYRLLLLLVEFLNQLRKHIRLSVYIFLDIICSVNVNRSFEDGFGLGLL